MAESSRRSSLPQYEQYHQYEILGISFAGLAFDVIWAMALGLDATVQRIVQGDDSSCEDLPGDLVPLEDFNYTNKRLGCIMKQSMRNVNFTGVTVS